MKISTTPEPSTFCSQTTINGTTYYLLNSGDKSLYELGTELHDILLMVLNYNCLEAANKLNEMKSNSE